MANISKSTPYVRYRENISSSLHLGRIHVESEYLDRTKPTTIESIHGMTWHNRVFNENKELPLLSDETISLSDKHREYFDTGEKRVPIDEIYANEECVANEDGTYTYEVRSYEGDYTESYDGVNYFKSLSKQQLNGEMEITYNTNEEDILGSLVIDDTIGGINQIEDSKDGILEKAVITGKTLVNNVLENSKDTEYIVLGEDINTNKQMTSLEGTVEGEVKGAILKGNTLVNLFDTNLVTFSNKQATVEKGVITMPIKNHLYNSFEIPKEKCSMFKPSTTYTLIVDMLENSGQPQENETEQAISFGLNSFSETIVKNEGVNYNCIFNHREVGRKIVTFTTYDKETYDEKTRGIQFRLETYFSATQGQQKLSIVILEGDYTNVDIPYFEGMQSVKMPVLETTGKNLFDGELEVGIYNTVTGKKIGDDRFRNVSPIEIEANMPMVVSGNESGSFYKLFYDENMNFISASNSPCVISPINAKFLNFYSNTTGASINEFVQLEYGTVATSFEPYKSNILSTPSDLELRGIGDVQDTLDLLTGELAQRVGEIVLDGSDDENWVFWDSKTLNVTGFYLNYQLPNAIEISHLPVCNLLPSLTLKITEIDCENIFVSDTKKINLNISNSKATTVEELKTYLKTNPLIVQYQFKEKVHKTVDLSCVDQDGSTQPNRVKTYDTITHFQLSSDTLTPSLYVPSTLDYDAMLQPSKQYTLRMERPTSGECSVDVGGTVVTLEDGEQIKTFSTLDTLSHSEVKFTTGGQKVNKVMLLDGNEQGSIEYFIGMQSVKMPVLRTIGKNLFDGEYIKGAYIVGGKYDDVTYLNTYSTIIKVKECKTYTISWSQDSDRFGIVTYNSYPKNELSYVRIINDPINTTISNKTFTLNNDEKYIQVIVSSNSASKTPTWIQLEENSIVTSYEDNKSNILTVNEDIELRGIGNVKDELDVNSGEVITKFNKIKLNGNEGWTQSSAGYYRLLLGNYPKHKEKGLCVCDKIPVVPSIVTATTGIKMVTNEFIQVKVEGVSTLEGFKLWLQNNNTTVMYELAEPVHKTIDLEILDQNGDNVHNFKTYPTITHIYTSSDELIPSTQVDYKVASSVETVTGYDIKVENGERADLISCKLYGETLQNVLPSSPTLRNSMDSISMQKLNEDYDDVNIVDGEVKSAILKGNTLVNVNRPTTKDTDNRVVENGWQLLTTWTTSYNTWEVNDISLFKSNTKYFIKVEVVENTLTSIWNGFIGTTNCVIATAISDVQFEPLETGIKYGVFTTKSDFTEVTVGLRSATSNTEEIGKTLKYRVMIIEYQDGMENWDIPYFEEMSSVKTPTLQIFNNANLFDSNIEPELFYLSDDGVYKSTSTLTINQTVKINGSLTISFYNIVGEAYARLGEFDKDKNFIKRTLINTSPTTISLDDETEYVVFSVDASDVKYFENLQITRLGKIQLSNILSTPEDLVLGKVGDVEDTLNLLTGEVVERTKEIVLDGSDDELWITNVSYENGSFRFLCNAYPIFKSYSRNVICDKLSYIDTNGDNSNLTNEIHITSTTSTGKIQISTTKTLEDFKSWLLENPITVRCELAEQVNKTVDLSIVNQYGETLERLHCIDNGWIKLSSEEGSLIPSLDYEVPTNNSYYLDLIKTDTQYTSKGSSDCNATIDGESIALSSNGTFTTSSTITDKLMILDTPVDDLMFIEGDVASRTLEYFEGIIGVEEPTIHIHSDNLIGGAVIPQNYSDYILNNGSNNYAHTKTPFLKLKPNTKYCSLVETETDPKTQIIIRLYTSAEEMVMSSNCNNVETKSVVFTHRAIFETDETGELYLGGYNFNTKDNFNIWLKHMNRAKWLIWENGTLGSSNTQSYIEALGTKLQPLQPTTLNSIGDVKDEIDFVNDTITRRIGNVVFDGSNDESWEYNETYDIFVNKDLEYTDSFLSTHKLMNVTWNSASRFTLVASEYGITSTESGLSYLYNNPITILYVLETPITEHINLVKPYYDSSVASLTLSSQLNIGDCLKWNPYQEKYVRYNADGTTESLDLTDRQYIELYYRKTYVEQNYNNKVISHGSTGTTYYCLLEPSTEFDVIARFPELPDGDIEVNLGGTIGVMEVKNSIGRTRLTTPQTLQNHLCIIYSDGIKATVTDVMVFKHVGTEDNMLELDYCSGVNGIGEIVTVDGVSKSKIVLGINNGNLITAPCEIYNSGNNIKYMNVPVKPNTTYIIKVGECEIGNVGCAIEQKDKNGGALPSIVTIGSTVDSTGGMFTTDAKASTLNIYRQISDKGSAHNYSAIELAYKDMSKEGLIRPINYDEFEFILPMQLFRINLIYDNLYYDELKGYYRIQQSIGHKIFTGADSESWTLISDGDRVMKFRYNNADIQLKQQGEYTTNLLPVTETDSYDSCYFNGTNFTVTITKERLTNATLTGFKEWLSNNNLHLMYQLTTPLMHELPQYSGRVELPTYRDEILSTLKNCLNTEVTLGVATDKTYRWHELEESQGYMNRIMNNDERLTKEDTLYINRIEGKGIANLIEDTNNVPTLLKPNYSGKATSHQLTNSKQSTIKVHGFESNGGTCGVWNSDTNMYELKVMSGDSSYTNTNSKVLNIPYQLETYEDGTYDKVIYDEENKVWVITGGATKTIEFDSSTGQFTNQVELFKGMAPRTGLFAEIKVRFSSGITSARIYYSLDGTNFGYSTLRSMSDDVDYYIGFFNTGGTKIDYAIKYSAEAEYTNLVALSSTIPTALVINQIQNITECTQYVDKTYYYDTSVLPLELDTYDGTTNIYMEGNTTDTNIIINNIALQKQCLTYSNKTYTVYWKYLGGEGNITISLGGTTVSVDGKQEYATIKTALNAPQDALIVGGYNLSIQDLMLIKGDKIDDLAYFEGSRQVGTLYVDEDGNPVLDDNGNRQYKISLVSGTNLVQDAFEDSIVFEDTKKHNVLVTKLLGETLEKLD